MIRADKLRAIIDAPDDDLRNLAFLAGGHPASFYHGANFNDADLRGQDLRGFTLDAATFERARVDRNTRVNRKYFELIGLKRTDVKLPVGLAVIGAIKSCNIKTENPIKKHLGDMVEEAIYYRINNKNKKVNNNMHNKIQVGFKPLKEYQINKSILENITKNNYITAGIGAFIRNEGISFISDNEGENDLTADVSITKNTLKLLENYSKNISMIGIHANILLVDFLTETNKLFALKYKKMVEELRS